MQNQNHSVNRPGILALLISAVLVVALGGGGVLLERHVLPPTFNAIPLCIILGGAMALLCLVNRIAAGVFASRHFDMTPEEQEAFMAEHRAACDEDPKAVLARLGDIAVQPVTLLGLYYLLTAALTVSIGMISSGAGIGLAVLPLFLFFMPLYNQLSALPEPLRKDALVPEGELPYLEALCRRAADTVGIKGQIRLQISADHDCCVSRVGRVYIVFLGTRALSVVTEEEVYGELLYHFGFYTRPWMARRLRLHYHLASLGSAKMRGLTWVFDLFYSLPDAYMEWYGPLYSMALSRYATRLGADFVRREGFAAESMSLRGKCGMWDYFDHEWFRHLPGSYYAEPVARPNYEQTVCAAFRRTLPERYGVWGEWLLDKLPPEGYIGMSLAEYGDLLGVGTAPATARPVFHEPDSDFGHAVRDAINHVIARMPPLSPEAYAAARQRYYLDELAVIEAWESSDKSRPTYEISPVINAYRILARYRELEALCDDVLAREPDYAHAMYDKGACLLLRYDTTGIDYIYRAMDLNKNYMKDGLELVEGYCRLMGLAEELSSCYRRGDHLMEAHGANHEGASCLQPSDRLIRETELCDSLPTTLAYMIEAGEGCIERIYLVRKVIAEDFFTSAFVLYITPGTSDEQMDRTYEAIFHYLDAADWQYSLFFYDRATEMALKKVPEALVWEKEG